MAEADDDAADEDAAGNACFGADAEAFNGAEADARGAALDGRDGWVPAPESQALHATRESATQSLTFMVGIIVEETDKT